MVRSFPWHVCASNALGFCDACASLGSRLRASAPTGAATVSAPYAGNRERVAAVASACGAVTPTPRRVRRALAPFLARERSIASQAETFALRASMDATWRVWIRFARGAHDVRLSREAPKGYQEARASRKVRGDSPGLRYGAAERIADGIGRKLAPVARRA